MKLDKKDLEVRLKHLGETIKCGFHSNIPACCIKYFITKHLWLGSMEKMHLSNERRKKKYPTFEKFNYIPCDTCLKRGKPNKIKRCNCWHAAESEGDIVKVKKLNHERIYKIVKGEAILLKEIVKK